MNLQVNWVIIGLGNSLAPAQFGAKPVVSHRQLDTMDQILSILIQLQVFSFRVSILYNVYKLSIISFRPRCERYNRGCEVYANTSDMI